MRYVFLILIAAVVIYFWRASWRRRSDIDQKSPETDAGEMVQCQSCGVYLPRNDAVMDGASYFCCVEHRDKGR